MEAVDTMKDLVVSLEPPKAVILAITTLGLALGGLLIAIGERDRGVGYLIAALLGGILAWNAKSLLSLVGL
ncbi:hypothetical protein [Thermus thermophilus]|uniref:hypothetical protein n=1 Tax=Thermus thermophilus TaxID=274 RepID=UPI001FCB9001|nr:hypothetical protein [Thermus thermophilus]BDG25246.1 hypothetical protein TthSNM33_24400 [Thermus thermophilus]BDG25274.1 hypothetical protein TthSNM33_24680 [Thermus thermophilus]